MQRSRKQICGISLSSAETLLPFDFQKIRLDGQAKILENLKNCQL